MHFLKNTNFNFLIIEYFWECSLCKSSNNIPVQYVWQWARKLKVLKFEEQNWNRRKASIAYDFGMIALVLKGLFEVAIRKGMMKRRWSNRSKTSNNSIKMLWSVFYDAKSLLTIYTKSSSNQSSKTYLIPLIDFCNCFQTNFFLFRWNEVE